MEVCLELALSTSVQLLGFGSALWCAVEQKYVGRELLTPVEAGLPGLHVLLPTAAFDAWASVPGSALSTRPPILVGQVGGQRVPGQSRNNVGASAEVGVLVSPETTVFSSRATT